VKKKEIRVTVNSVFKKGQLVKKDETATELEAVVLDKELPLVTVSLDKAVTYNLGNYQSAKFSGFISVPCYLSEEDIDAAFEFCERKLDENMTRIINEEMKALNEQSK